MKLWLRKVKQFPSIEINTQKKGLADVQGTPALPVKRFPYMTVSLQIMLLLWKAEKRAYSSQNYCEDFMRKAMWTWLKHLASDNTSRIYIYPKEFLKPQF